MRWFKRKHRCIFPPDGDFGDAFKCTCGEWWKCGRVWIPDFVAADNGSMVDIGFWHVFWSKIP